MHVLSNSSYRASHRLNCIRIHDVDFFVCLFLRRRRKGTAADEKGGAGTSAAIVCKTHAALKCGGGLSFLRIGRDVLCSVIHP